MKKTILSSTFWQKVMRLTFAQLALLVCFTSLTYAFDSKAQLLESKVSVHVTDGVVATVLKKLEKQTGVKFIFSPQVIKADQRINVSFQEVAFGEVLDKTLQPLRIKYEVSGKYILLSNADDQASKAGISLLATGLTAAPVDIPVTGRVIDEAGIVLPGVSVVLKGSQRGTITDQNGDFSVTVPNNESVLVFSFVGYQSREVMVGFNTRLDITLPIDNKSLEEVVVVGYGTQKKVNLTGSVATVSGSELQRIPTNNLTNAIGGRMPGIISVNGNGRPGSGSSISIRGLSTLNDNSPLVVVDGIVRSDGFGNIDPNEVESISILKDASAASVYGARASNGVILVTTRRGKMGKPSISYTNTTGIQNPTQYPKLMSSYDYAVVRNQALRNQGFNQANPTQAGLFFSDAALESFRPGVTDWYTETFKRNSIQSLQNLTINGGTESIRYFVSLGHVDQNGMYDKINFKRFNLRSNVDAKINKNLTVGLNLEGRKELSSAPAFDANQFFELVVRSSPLVRPYHPSGRPFNTQGEHPVEMIYSSGYDDSRTNVIQGTLFFEHDLPFITKGLSVRGNYSYFSQQRFKKVFFTPYSLYDEDASGNVTNTKIVGGRTRLSQTFEELNNNTLNLSLNYSKTLLRHEISGLLLYEQFSAKGNIFSARKEDFATNIKDDFFASGPANQSIDGSSIINDARRSVVGRVNYAFDSKYLFEATFRYDGSYRFPKSQRYGFFPAFSAGWRVSEEDFFKNSAVNNIVNSLKFKFSKGLIGNDRVNAFQFTDAYNIVAGSGPIVNGQALPFVQYGVYPNANITWEKQDNTNFGLDALLLNSKIGFEFDYFFRNTRDILWSRTLSIPGTFGRTLPNENYAEVKSRGMELMISYKNNIRKLGYDFRLIGSYAQNQVTKIDDPANALDFQKQLNRPIGVRTGYEALGIFRSQEEADSWVGGSQFGQKSKAGDIKYADLDGDGKISIPDQKVISEYGNVPRIMYGLNTSLTYGNFDLNFLLQGAAMRNLMLSGSGRVMYRNGGSNNNFEYLKDSWSPENPNAKYPISWIDQRIVNNRDSDFWLRKAGYLRFRSVDLGYSFNPEWLKRKHVQRLRLFVSAVNLLTISKIREFDPEAETGSGSYYPQQKNINIGLNVSF